MNRMRYRVETRTDIQEDGVRSSVAVTFPYRDEHTITFLLDPDTAWDLPAELMLHAGKLSPDVVDK
jgi:hypothetical protein